MLLLFNKCEKFVIRIITRSYEINNILLINRVLLFYLLFQILLICF